VELTQERAGWSWASLRVLSLDAGASLTIESKDEEMLALPLEGSWMVACGDDEFVLEGRESVFSSPTDFSYIGRRLVATLTSNDGGRIALAGARARRDLPFRYASAGETIIELRGSGACSRQVNKVCMPDRFEADRLLVCEVITPADNWSSYPPHKHDENDWVSASSKRSTTSR